MTLEFVSSSQANRQVDHSQPPQSTGASQCHPKKYWDAFALYALLSCNAKPVLLKNDNHLQPRLFAKSTVYIPDDSPNDVDYRENYSSDFRSFLSSYGSLFFPSLVKSSQPNFQLYFKTEVSIIFTIFF